MKTEVLIALMLESGWKLMRSENGVNIYQKDGVPYPIALNCKDGDSIDSRKIIDFFDMLGL